MPRRPRRAADCSHLRGSRHPRSARGATRTDRPWPACRAHDCRGAPDGRQHRGSCQRGLRAHPPRRRSTTSAKREEQAPNTVVESRGYRLAESEGVGVERAQRTQQRDSAGVGQFDDTSAAGQEQPPRVDRSMVRTAVRTVRWPGRPCGPCTVTGLRRVPGTAISNASRVPSPPSAIGRSRRMSSGCTLAHPSARARATSMALAVPVNESGVITTVRLGMPPAWQGVVLDRRPRAPSDVTGNKIPTQSPRS